MCTGNVNRSFVAEKYASAVALRRGTTVFCDSAGIGAQSYFKVPRQASAFLAGEGVTGWTHTPKLVSEELVNWADLILVMENVHFDELADRFPQSLRKMSLFLDYCTNSDGKELPDPMGKSNSAFLEAFTAIKSALETCPLFK